MGDGRAEGSLVIGDGGQAEISLMPDTKQLRHHASGFCGPGIQTQHGRYTLFLLLLVIFPCVIYF